MSSRHAHLVGSMPAADAAGAMRVAMDRLGPRLRSLPDGETGERRDWIKSIIDSFREHPDLELTTSGDWSDYDHTPRFALRRGHHLYGANLDLGEVAAVEQSWPIFQQVRAEAGRPDLAFQVGIPGDFDLAMFTFGPAGALRHRRPFTEATIGELRRMHAILGEDAVFQLEVPAELVLLTRVPAGLQPVVARILAARIVELAVGSPEGTRFGVHLCLGDLNHRSLATMADVAPLVRLTNAIAARWPAGRRLEFVHAPFAAADHPPPVEESFYAPLASLQLPPRVRFIAGFAHEDQPLGEQLRIRDIIDRLLRTPVDIATSCGLGRRSTAQAEAAMDRTAELCAG